MAEILIGTKIGVGSWFILGDSLCKALTTIQSNPLIFGIVDLVAPAEQLSSTDQNDNPTWLILQDCGLKLRFDYIFQRLDLIEVYFA